MALARLLGLAHPRPEGTLMEEKRGHYVPEAITDDRAC
jgi:hypothetical protein